MKQRIILFEMQTIKLTDQFTWKTTYSVIALFDYWIR